MGKIYKASVHRIPSPTYNEIISSEMHFLVNEIKPEYSRNVFIGSKVDCHFQKVFDENNNVNITVGDLDGLVLRMM